MDTNDLKKRIKAYALQIVRVAKTMPKDNISSVLARQLLRSGTCVGSSYRSACRAKTQMEFLAQMRTVKEECEDTLYWLELLIACGKISKALVARIMKEGHEILGLVGSTKTRRA